MSKVTMKWHTTAGGTSAYRDRHGYTAHGDFGDYHIGAPTRRLGGYSLMWANTKGRHAVHGGLWHDLGHFRSPNAAKAAAREHEITTRRPMETEPRGSR